MHVLSTGMSSAHAFTQPQMAFEYTHLGSLVFVGADKTGHAWISAKWVLSLDGLQVSLVAACSTDCLVVVLLAGWLACLLAVSLAGLLATGLGSLLHLRADEAVIDIPKLCLITSWTSHLPCCSLF